MIKHIEYLIKLIDKLPKNAKTNKNVLECTESISVYKSAINLNIDSNLIKSLHYFDLQILIASLKIDEVSKLLNQLRKNKLKGKGIDEIIEATPNDYNSL